ncbi:MAG: signal recognition particle-docking protein FtsY [Planctomycetota bacterium]|nr:MAG: signal recognition particle-docking protein FtsY [Planctomycetota bacterium]
MFFKKKTKDDASSINKVEENKDEGVEKTKKKGFFARLKEGLKKTRDKVSGQLKKIFTFGRKVDEDLLEEIFEVLISADMGVEISQKIVDDIQEAYRDRVIENKESQELLDYIKQKLKENLTLHSNELNFAESPPTVILVAGVNGTGKTTSIAKLANMLQKEGKKVILAAGDTFRAAAVEQLEIWANRLGVDIVKQKTGADPAAVVFDALDAALARGHDVVIVDTAGRLHTQTNLMRELEKIGNVIKKKVPGAPHEVLLVLDATTGQNALRQAEEFKSILPLTGLVLTKLDGTAKGGIIVAINNKISIPVKFVGLGEKVDDWEPFDAQKFVDALFE